MSTIRGTRERTTDEDSGRPLGSAVHVADGTRRAAGTPRRARKRQRAILLLVASLALLVPIGLQVQRTMAEQAVAARTMAAQAVDNQALAAQAVADQAVAAQAVADQAAAAQAAADKAAADKAAADKAAADRAAADRAAAAAIARAKAAQPAPGTGGLVPALSLAFTRARIAARAEGLDLRVNSGFRSTAAQQRLYDEAIATYGSVAKARRWVLPPAESDHVKGLAVDVGPPAAAAWLEKNGVRYGLCRRYLNEWWHFERLAPAVGQRCPALEPYAGA